MGVGRASASSTWAACAKARRSATSSPTRKSSTRRARHGLVAAPPSATRMSAILPSTTDSAAATDTSANSYDARSRTFRYSDRRATGAGGTSIAVISSPWAIGCSRCGESPGSRKKSSSG